MAKVAAKKSPRARVVNAVVKKPTAIGLRVPKKSKATPNKRVDSQAIANRIVQKVFTDAAASIKRKTTTDQLVTLPSNSVLKPKIAPRRNLVPDAVTASDVAVVLPQNIAPRLQAKQKALNRWYEETFPHVVANIATRTGVVFVITAAAVLTQFVWSEFNNWSDFQASVICSTLSCEDGTQTTSTETISQTTSSSGDTTTAVTTSTTEPTTAMSSPAIRFITKPPSPLKTVTEVVVHVEYVKELTVNIESRLTGERYNLTASGEPSGGEYRFALTPGRYAPGEYELRARGIALRDLSVVRVTGSRFYIEPSVSTTATETETSTSSTLTTSGEATTKEAETVLKVAATTTTATSTVAAEVPLAPTALSLTLEQSSVAFSKRVTVRAHEATGVELYAQKLQATQPTLLGLMTRVDATTWRYLLDTSKISNGSYVVFGRARTAAGLLTTPKASLEVQNPIAPQITEAVNLELTEPVLETKAALAATTSGSKLLPDRTQYFAPPPPLEQSTEVPAAPATAAVREQLEQYETELNDLLQRYASAIQVNDTSLRTLALKELDTKREAILKDAVQAGASSVTASELAAGLEDEFGKLQKRVEVFETLLKDRSAQNSAKDSDADGISDYDEETLYETNPRIFDTDGDGVPDGAEIMRGFDPHDAGAESVLVYVSPKDFGIVRDDVLKVAEVVPVIETDGTRGTPRIQAEIRGQALPNSFVTLYIYSTPTIITVKTEADGSFVYQFDKELEDGEHHVYVAVTDNTGDIIAKSNPFSFVKRAEAFTPTQPVDETVVTANPVATPHARELYNVVAAMGVLAFGLILLILGIGMRKSKGVVGEVETPNPLTSN